MSLSNCVVGAFSGAALATTTQIQTGFLLVIVVSWITAPFACAVAARSFYFLILRVEKRISLVSLVETNRLLLLLVVFFVSFTLGANNIGLILSFAGHEGFSSITLNLVEVVF